MFNNGITRLIFILETGS